MAFTTIKKGVPCGRGHNPIPQVSIAKYSAGSGQTDITFNKAFVAAFGMSLGERVQVGVGSGADDGLLAIAKTTDAAGFKISRSGNGSMTLRLSSVFGKDASFKRTVCQHNIVNGVIYVTLPTQLATSATAFMSGVAA